MPIDPEPCSKLLVPSGLRLWTTHLKAAQSRSRFRNPDQDVDFAG